MAVRLCFDKSGPLFQPERQIRRRQIIKRCSLPFPTFVFSPRLSYRLQGKKLFFSGIFSGAFSLRGGAQKPMKK
jgi:hypothetical protein